MTPIVRRTLVVLISVLALLAPASLAHAATASKTEVLAGWTQPTAASTAAWNAARIDRGPWSSYGFDWSTDYCSASPDNPLGFDFTLSCWHHDFGYRNYKAMGRFTANKDRLDTMFYADLKRKCATYFRLFQPPCYRLAWTYYRAVHAFGSLTAVKSADLERARQMKLRATARQ